MQIEEYKKVILLPLIFSLFIFAIFYVTSDVKRFEREIEKYEKILKKDPGNAGVSLKCGQIYYQQAFRETTDAKTIELLDKTVEHYRRAIALNRKSLIPSTVFYHLGVAYFKKSLILGGDYFYYEAELEFRRALAKNPSLKEAHLYLGHIYSHQGRKKEAHQEYQKAGELGLVDPISTFDLACKYKDSGQYNEAIRFFNKAIATKGLKKENLLEARLALGWLYYNKKDYEESIKEYEKALRIDDSSVKAYYWLGKAYEALGDKESAKCQWRKVLQINPHHKEAKTQLRRK